MSQFWHFYKMRLLLVLSVMLSAVWWTTMALYAQDDSNQPGVDVLFIVDQSGSMGGIDAGSEAHPEVNDTLGLRFEAPENFVRLMAEDIVQIRKEAGGLHRVALIDFGDTAQTRFTWESIAPQSWEELNAQMKSLAEEGGLAPGRYQTTNLGNTNFIGAFEAAASLFGQLGAPTANRERVIILLTDGYPCVWLTEAKTCANQTQHMATVAELARANFPTPAYKLYVVAMNDSNGNYWDEFGPRWTAIAGEGHARKVDSNDDVGVLFHEIWRELTRELTSDVKVTETKIAPGPIVVPPYLDTITFTLFKQRPEETLEVRDATNQALTADMENVSVSGENIYRLTVFRPLPGVWRVSTTGSDEDVDITMASVVARGYLKSPTSAGVQFAPITIEWQLLDSRGQTLPEYEDERYRLRPSVTVQVGDQVLDNIGLDYKGDSTYAATMTPSETGLHLITMEAVAKDVEEQEIEVFRGQVGEFNVNPIAIQAIGLPKAHPQFSTMTLEYMLIGADGSTMRSAADVALSVTFQSGAENYSMNLSRTTDGHFQGEFVPVIAGSYQIVTIAELRDTNGVQHTIRGQAPDDITVTPVTLQPVDLATEWQQLVPKTLLYEFQDPSGKAVDIAVGITPLATIQADDGEHPLSLQRLEDGRYQGVYTPLVTGRHEVQVALSVQDAAGEKSTLPPQLAESVEVEPLRLKPIALPATVPIFTSQSLTYEYQDAKGSRIAVDPQLTLSLLARTGGTSWPVTLQRSTDNTFGGIFIPIVADDYVLEITGAIQDETGAIQSLPKAAAGAFSVQAPQFKIVAPSGTQAQYHEMRVAYEVLNHQGEAVSFAPGYQLMFTATVTLDGVTQTVLDLQPVDNRTFAATYKLNEARPYDLAAMATVVGPGNTHYLLFSDELAQISVMPTTLIGIQLVQPLSGSLQQQMIRKLSLQPLTWFSEPNPLVVEAHLVDANGALVDPQLALEDSTHIPLQLSVVRSATRADVTEHFTLVTTGVPGIYRAEGWNLPRDEYQVSMSVAADLPIRPNFMIDETLGMDTGAVRLIENWWWLGLWGVIIMAGIVTGSGTAIGIARSRQRRLHPAKGTLTVEGDYGNVLWSRTVDGSNYLLFKRLPVTTHIKQLEVRCNNEADSKQGVVQVLAILDDNTRVRGTLRAGSQRLPLGKYRSFLKKIN